jgi:hypothetical protein
MLVQQMSISLPFQFLLSDKIAVCTMLSDDGPRAYVRCHWLIFEHTELPYGITELGRQ